ncbi:MAG TPA: CsbD family protein [Burkholderiales bacterium]|jgi:uncharacterized protein YjbJ (UPF0337 family)|nr:CsbD family protein [Burkholderiales bacterium]
MTSPDIWNRIAAEWDAFKGLVRDHWLKLTEDDIAAIAGNRDRLIGRIQARYGVGRDEAEREVRDWEMHV